MEQEQIIMLEAVILLMLLQQCMLFEQLIHIPSHITATEVVESQAIKQKHTEQTCRLVLHSPLALDTHLVNEILKLMEPELIILQVQVIQQMLQQPYTRNELQLLILLHITLILVIITVYQLIKQKYMEQH